jgi:hypothetical protein
MEGVRHLDRTVALGRLVVGLVGLVWGFSLQSLFLSFSVPVSQQEIPRGDKLIEFQAEGGRGIAMTGGISIRVTLISSNRFLETTGARGDSYLCLLSDVLWCSYCYLFIVGKYYLRMLANRRKRRGENHLSRHLCGIEVGSPEISACDHHPTTTPRAPMLEIILHPTFVVRLYFYIIAFVACGI